VLKAGPEKSWIEAKPKTGRTHQIRLHCLERRHSILGDRFYGKAHPQGLPMALHARALAFEHPITGKPVSIEADPPDYWREHWLRGL
jgi:23S rRNA-/tRNA-specific pseudouridylate synthase